MNTTIVSAFITNINNRPDYEIDKYLENGKKFIDLKIPKIIFLEKKIYEKYFDNKLIDFEFTKFILFEKREIYFYDYIHQITNFNISGNPNKDTLEYMFIQCHKTEWVKKAIEINSFRSNNFIWIDFGIYYIIKDPCIFECALLNLIKKSFSKIRIASCWDLNMNYNVDIYKNVNWYFAGGVFGGDKESLIKFADLMKNKCLSIIKDKGTIMWEVNIWYLIYREIPELFCPYQADHKLTILTNY